MWGPSSAMRKGMAAMMPALLLGLAAGVTGGVWAASALDTTPYGATDFNTASRDAHQAGKAEGWKEAREVSAQAAARLRAAADGRVDRLEARIATLRQTITKQEKALTQAQKAAAKQHAALARAESSLAESTAALSNATGELGDGHTVEGTLNVTRVLGRKAAQESQQCAESLRTFQVRVTAGAGATVDTARLVGAEATRRTTKRGTKRNPKPDVVTVSCSLTYAANLPTPLGSAYRFVAVKGSAPNTPLDSESAAGAALQDGSGPALSLTR